MIIKKENIKRQETKQDDIVVNELPIVEENQEEVVEVPKEPDEKDTIEQFEDIDISQVNFQERIERRRGDRRRGYRRIDERSLVSRAQEEAMNIREIAKQEGYEEGLSGARQEIEEVKRGIQEFFSSKKEVYEEVAKDILEIALEVAKKIIKKEVDLSDEILHNILLEVLEQVKADEQKLTFKVSEDDYELAVKMIPNLLQEARIDAKLSVIPSEEIEKGSCVLIANNGVIDANFKTQLRIIQMAFGIYDGKDDEI